MGITVNGSSVWKLGKVLVGWGYRQMRQRKNKITEQGFFGMKGEEVETGPIVAKYVLLICPQCGYDLSIPIVARSHHNPVVGRCLCAGEPGVELIDLGNIP